MSQSGMPVQQDFSGSIAKETGGNLDVIAAPNQPTLSTTTELGFTTFVDTTKNVTLLAANTARRSARIINTSDLAIPISEGGTAARDSYSKLLEPGTDFIWDFPACTVALNGYFSRFPDNPILITERTI